LIEREAERAPAEEPQVNLGGIEEVVADKGYHSGPVLEEMKAAGVRTYIPEKKQMGQRHWAGKEGQQQAVYENRQRLQRPKGKHLLRQRGELIERSFAHCYDTGGMRPNAPAQTLEYSEAAVDSRGSVQSELDPAQVGGRRNAAGVEKPHSPACFSVFVPISGLQRNPMGLPSGLNAFEAESVFKVPWLDSKLPAPESRGVPPRTARSQHRVCAELKDILDFRTGMASTALIIPQGK